MKKKAVRMSAPHILTPNRSLKNPIIFHLEILAREIVDDLDLAFRERSGAQERFLILPIGSKTLRLIAAVLLKIRLFRTYWSGYRAGKTSGTRALGSNSIPTGVPGKPGQRRKWSIRPRSYTTALRAPPP